MPISDPYLVPQGKITSKFVAYVPGSKSLTNRAVIAAALCVEKVLLKRPLLSEDTEVASVALKQLGVKFTEKGEDWEIDASEFGLNLQNKDLNLFLANAGTAVRFLSSVLAAKGISCRVHGSDRMHERPIEILLKGLKDLGATIDSEKENGCPPLLIGNSTLKGGETELSGQVSSQFFSGLMMACPLASGKSTVKVSDEWLSKPYIEMTSQMLKSFGVDAKVNESTITIEGQQAYKSPGEYQIEPDASAATYPLALGVLQKAPVCLKGLGKGSLQGDVKFVDVLKEMGCEVTVDTTEINVTPPDTLKAISLDLNHIPDAAMTVVVLCALANGKSHLSGLRNLAFKECDRLKALETELQKVGAKVTAYEDGFHIEGVPMESLHGAKIETYKDHRMAMCLGILGTVVPGIEILDPGCVNKTFPEFWDSLKEWLAN